MVVRTFRRRRQWDVRRVAIVVASLAIGAGAAVACSSPPANVGMRGDDGGAPPSGLDASYDGNPFGVGPPMPGCGVDADLQWQPVPGCNGLAFAKNPAALGDGLDGAWQPCGAGFPAGCLVRAQGSTPQPVTAQPVLWSFGHYFWNGQLEWVDPSPLGLVGGALRSYGACCMSNDPGGGPDPGGCRQAAYYVVDPVADHPVMAFTVTQSTCAALMAYGDYGVVLATAASNAQKLTLVTAAWSGAPTVQTPSSPSVPFEAIAVSDTRVLGSIYGEGSVAIDPTTGASKPIASPELILPPLGVHGGFVARPQDEKSIVFLGDDGSFATLVAPAGKKVFGLAVDRANGDALAWVEGVSCTSTGEGSCMQLEIWTSPYATSASALQAHKLTSSVGAGVIANGGMIAYTDTSFDVVVRRVADGTGWTFSPAPYQGLPDPFWVDANDVWMSGVPTSGGTSGRAIFRVPLASLGDAGALP